MKAKFIYCIALLHILLFSYAATSKLVDYDTFVIQLGQSPLLGAFASIVAIGVPVIEYSIATLLLFQKTRTIGLYASFTLMCLFSVYITLIVYYSPFTPCSCGGILEKMDWNEHLIFNIVFILLSGCSLIVHNPNRYTFGYLFILLLFSFFFLGSIYKFSEEILENQNNFTRILPQQFLKDKEKELNYNSYYIAGFYNDKIILGNTTAPLLITIIDTNLTAINEKVIKLNNTKLPFRSLQIQSIGKDFYAYDGTIPAIFKGKISNWKANLLPSNPSKFSNPIFPNENTTIYRTHLSNMENTLASWRSNLQYERIYPNLLQKQKDGIFDTDGVLSYDPYSKLIVYNYYYRNGYLVTDENLNVIRRGHTIDTFDKAQIKVVYDKKRKERKLGAPPKTINKYNYAYKGLLFVNSTVRGKNETSTVAKQTSVIDIYNLKEGKYIVSFYVYDIAGEKLNRFAIANNHFYGIIGTKLVRYRLSPWVTNKYSTTIKK